MSSPENGPLPYGMPASLTQIADALKDAKIVAIRGHGTFALAETLHECLYLTHLLETSCRMSFMRSSMAGKAAMR
jgi:ribulose-5-phosphate 4-epimerase/fuculose-1-phosphate aldolase